MGQFLLGIHIYTTASLFQMKLRITESNLQLFCGNFSVDGCC